MNLDSRIIINKGLEKIDYMEKSLNDFPHITKNGQWLTHMYGHWTGGFWVGLLWLKALLCKNSDAFQENALQWAKRLKKRMSDNKTHDMGFLFGPSCILGYNILNDQELLEMCVAGAQNMMDLYEKRAGLILAWDEPGYEGITIVDTIMNLPLLAWVAEKMNVPEYRKIAENVADNILHYFIRSDASTYHVVRWDTHNFKIVEKATHQGFSADSCWSRGQAWALYGFANMYRYTGKKRYLEISENLASYFWNHLDEATKLPRWDFIFQNNSNEPIDASAAAIAASGMLLLSELIRRSGMNLHSEIWSARGETLIKALADYCLYSQIDKYGIIQEVTVDKPHNSGVGESAMYGDYYFMEANYRLLNQDNTIMLDLLF
jgi:unsaturated chondroitin disaccharide hydrolase